MIVIDRLCYNSGLRYVNAMEKFVFSMLTLLLCVSSRSIIAAILVLLVTGTLTVEKGGIPLLCYLKLITIPLVFLFLSISAVLINISRTPLDAFAIPFGSFYLTGNVQGLLWGVQLISTALASVSCLYFLSLSTPVTDILGVLKKLHVPGLITELMLLIYRYIFITLRTASAILISQSSRLGNKSLHTARKSFVAMASSVFVLSVRQAGAQYDAMEARCYNGRIQILSEEHPAKYSEIFCIAGFEVFLFVLIVILKYKSSI